MPNYTQNLELIKPLPNENYNVENFNNNADIIDQAITEQAGALASHLADTMPHLFTDGTKTYKWGLKVVNGIVIMKYEEVV